VISVAMATCQGERWVERQLRSILEQLAPDDEIVLADASSDDRTLEIARGLRDRRVRIVEGIPRGDVPSTFETALGACRGDLLFLSDQDDVWLAGKVEKCRQALADGSILVLHDARLVDAEERTVADSFLDRRGFRPGFWPNLLKPGYLGCALAFRRELLDLALPFPVGLPMHDWWLGLLAERSGVVKVLREPLILHRRHGSNVNFDPGRSPIPLAVRISSRLSMWRQTRRRLERAP
jgi:glycosyltransferase involved in cell wall biosynthesis